MFPITVDPEDLYIRDISLAVKGNDVYIAYTHAIDTSDWTCVLKFARSEDDGSTWNDPITIDSDGEIGGFVSIAADSEGSLYISYWEHASKRLKLAKSTDYGAGWEMITVDSEASVVWENSMAIDYADTLYISYYDRDVVGLKFSRSTDGGTDWFTIHPDTGETADVGAANSIATDGNKVYISYTSFTETGHKLRFAKSTDLGDTW